MYLISPTFSPKSREQSFRLGEIFLIQFLSKRYNQFPVKLNLIAIRKKSSIDGNRTGDAPHLVPMLEINYEKTRQEKRKKKENSVLLNRFLHGVQSRHLSIGIGDLLRSDSIPQSHVRGMLILC